jgi:hypothetical protein
MTTQNFVRSSYSILYLLLGSHHLNAIEMVSQVRSGKLTTITYRIIAISIGFSLSSSSLLYQDLTYKAGTPEGATVAWAPVYINHILYNPASDNREGGE